MDQGRRPRKDKLQNQGLSGNLGGLPGYHLSRRKVLVGTLLATGWAWTGLRPQSTHAFASLASSTVLKSHRLSGEGEVLAVCTTAPGILLAIGRDTSERPAMWLVDTTTQTSEQVSLDATQFNSAEVLGVDHDGGNHVVVGSVLLEETVTVMDTPTSEIGGSESYQGTHRKHMPASWTSPNGREWKRNMISSLVQNARLVDVHYDGTSWVAVGGYLDDDAVEGVRGLIMTSLDGETWTEVPLDPAQAALSEGMFEGVTSVGGRPIAVTADLGGSKVFSRKEDLVWFGTAPDRAAFHDGSAVGIGSDGKTLYLAFDEVRTHTAQLATSKDGGTSWTEVGGYFRSLEEQGGAVKGLDCVADETVFAVGSIGQTPVVWLDHHSRGR
ncbi:hypothetical protein BH24ACT15_BH24ACT15_36840 [soil metagenome]